MKTLLLNQGGDLELDGQRNLRMVDGPEERTQAVRILLETAKGEWFLDTQHGTDYREILGSKPDLDEAAIRETIMEALEQEKRITDVRRLDISFDRRTRVLYIDLLLLMDGERTALELEVG